MLHRYKITPKSPLITPLMSDTLFGHFCWAIRYAEDEKSLLDFLKLYDPGKPAPVLFSSAFISGYLPRPSLPSPPRKALKEFTDSHFETELEGMKTIKKWNKQQRISTDQWQKLKKNYSTLSLYKDFFEEYRLKRKEKKYTETEVDMGNVISRITGTVEEGGLFVREKTWYHKDVTLDVYVEVSNDDMGEMADRFLTKYLPENGFGADKSVGMGHLSIEQDKSFVEKDYSVQNPNARISLSLAAFSGMEKYRASYNLTTKFGKLGGDYAFSSPTGGNPRPFKKPILMYEPGAVFLCSESFSNKPLLADVHSDQTIRHCGIPITLPFRLNEESYATAAA